MRMMREGSVYQLSFMPRFFPVNCYFVEEEDGLTLIDTALPFSSQSILKAAKSIGKPITNIVLTHAHDDHVGALDRLKDVLPHVPVYISKRDARLMAGDVTLDREEPQTPIRGGVPKKIKTRADVHLEDGDKIGSLVAISTPGHTPGQMAFLDTRSQAVIAGDAFQTLTGLTVVSDLKLRFPFPALATWNKTLALTSAEKLLNVKPSLLAVGHGNMLKNPEARMARAIDEAKRKIERDN
ncbi:MBL fold metallo-hydrolase [Alkalihalobacterium chitinilyticum]|uniref:MBL fold metallo-hydrolase n=1 Tax=Alkalihalobacterium chitinilyticum TaxID=2980103 RepID=A0ABT5VJU0_9BACI|nr:MBL fold metallo-hydrolase [Alkalihalobacterium chitinilyticum]MDE5415714.1 MBL fold metallo-hydrolase [Alkalihalobacterium chitinilyticum]